MKKLCILILGVLFLIPLSVKADMGPPAIKEVKVTPKSEDGASYYDCYDENFKKLGTLKYGETVTISEEYSKSGVKYGVFYDSKKEINGCIKISDVKNYSEKEKEKDEKAIYVGRVFSEDGVELYKGPSYVYEKTGDKVPYKAMVKISSIDASLGTWVYVEYEDISGYADVSDKKIAQLYKEDIIILENNKTFDEYYYFTPWDGKIAVMEDGSYKYYDAKAGFGAAWEYTTNIITSKTCKIREFAYDSTYQKTNKVIGEVSKGEEIVPIYSFGEYGYNAYYVKNNSIAGWINNEDECYVEPNYDDLTRKDGLKRDDVDYNFYAVKASDYFNEPSIDDPENPSKPSDKKEKKSEKVNDTILYCAIAAGAAVLASTVTVILVNKKKKNKVEE